VVAVAAIPIVAAARAAMLLILLWRHEDCLLWKCCDGAHVDPTALVAVPLSVAKV